MKRADAQAAAPDGGEFVVFRVMSAVRENTQALLDFQREDSAVKRLGWLVLSPSDPDCGVGSDVLQQKELNRPGMLTIMINLTHRPFSQELRSGSAGIFLQNELAYCLFLIILDEFRPREKGRFRPAMKVVCLSTGEIGKGC